MNWGWVHLGNKRMLFKHLIYFKRNRMTQTLFREDKRVFHSSYHAHERNLVSTLYTLHESSKIVDTNTVNGQCASEDC